MTDAERPASPVTSAFSDMLARAKEAYVAHGEATTACPLCGAGPVVIFYYQPAGQVGGGAVACRACHRGVLITRAETPDWYEGKPAPFDFAPVRRP